jgi:hypothetical protein
MTQTQAFTGATDSAFFKNSSGIGMDILVIRTLDVEIYLGFDYWSLSHVD